jgi:glutathione synthase/RimK-type ligase-like ATP-grasp enzyme
MRLVVPDEAWLAGRRPHVRLMAEAAAALGGRLELEAVFGHAGRYTGPDGRRRTLFGNAMALNPDAAAALAADKDYTARLLDAEGMPAPVGLLVFAPAQVAAMRLKNAGVAEAMPGAEAAAAFAARVGWPVIVKPNGGSEGRGVSRAEGPVDLAADLARLFQREAKVRIEALCPGEDHRLVVFDGRVRLAYRRRPVAVTGDGRQSVAALIEAARVRLAREARGPKLDPGDPQIARRLAAQGLGPASVPAAGQAVVLLPNANLSTGGAAEDLTGRLAPAAEALAVRAAAVLGLRLAGVDILAPDLAQGVEGATVLEVNSAPGLDGYAATGPGPWARARALMADLLAA